MTCDLLTQQPCGCEMRTADPAEETELTVEDTE